MSRKSVIALIYLLTILFASAEAQSTYTMPHIGIDTIYLTGDQCITILDPGGDGPYENNEDSYLYIISDTWFYLQIDYMLGLLSDGKDWVKIYYDTILTPNYLKDSLTGNGSKSYTGEQKRAIIHFHSNNYSPYDGFSIKIRYNNTIFNWSHTPLTDSSVQLTWDDTKESASGWKVYYWWDADSINSQQSSTKSATINGLRNDTWYAYYIVNNDYWCQSHTIKNMCAVTDAGSSILMAAAGQTTYDTLDNSHCYTLQGPSGNGSTNLYFPTSVAYYFFNKGHGVYLDGQAACTTNVNVSTSTSFYRLLANGSESYYSINSGNYSQYFPEGWVHMIYQNYSRGRFRVRFENGSVVVPVADSVTDSGATISWTDSTSASSWRFRYRSSEGDWNEAITTTPSITLAGLESGSQYIYSIEGLGDVPECYVPEPHAFITAGTGNDTIIMPFRAKSDTLRLEPGRCYTLLDAGGNKRYFDNDFSKLVLVAPSNSRLIIDGKCRLETNDKLYIDNATFLRFDEIEHETHGDMAFIAFESDHSTPASGFVLHVRLTDSVSTIDSLRAESISSTSATIRWSDTLATSWTLYYGNNGNNFDSVVTTQRQVVLTGLAPSTQYVYYVVSNLHGTSCIVLNSRYRKAFITQGGLGDTIVMPFRAADTVLLTDGQCYCIFDPGGPQHNYFDNDSSTLVLYSSTPFAIDGSWAATNSSNSDANDLLQSVSHYSGIFSNWNYNNNNTNRIFTSSRQANIAGQTVNYVILRFLSNLSINNPGFKLNVIWNPHNVTNVAVSNITANSAKVAWTQGIASTQNTIWYGADENTMVSIPATSNPMTLTGLQPGTQYHIRIGGDNMLCHASQTYTFSTLPVLGAGEVAMTSHGSDTLVVQHGECLTIYDPGGPNNYFPSDTSTLVLHTATGEGLYYSIQWSHDDDLYVTDGPNGYEIRLYQYPYSRQSWVPSGMVKLRFQSNEAIQRSGFVMKVYSASTVYGPNYQNMTDSSVTITWQDTSGATSWQFQYGPTIDSLTTVTTTQKQYHLTGLRRNKQYYYRIFNSDEDLTTGCYIDNAFGIIMPCDSDLTIIPYLNVGAQACNHYPLYYNTEKTLSANQCHHIVDDGADDKMFQKGDNTLHISVPDAQSITVRGYYELGGSQFQIYSYPWNTGTSFSGTGYIEKTVNNNFYIESRYGGNTNDYGFDFELMYNYQPTDINIVWDSANTAAATWTDTSSSQWMVTYGPAEKLLDTIITNQPHALLTGIRLNQQYVVYVIGTTPLDHPCKQHLPTKAVFSTIIDSSLIAMSYQTSQTITLDPNICYTVTDNSPEYGYFYDDDNGSYNRRLTLVAPPGMLISVKGWFRLESGDYLHIYYHDANNTMRDMYAPNNGNISLSNMKDFAIGRRINADTNIGDGFELHVSYSTITEIQTSLETDTTCRLTWKDVSDATLWKVYYGMDLNHMDSVVTNRPVAHLYGLEYGMHYTVFITSNASSLNCMDTAWFEFCSGNRDCLDYTDMTSCFATPYYGTFTSPRIWKGLIDYGADSIDSRHTVITDTNATDPRTGGMLRCVPTHAGLTNSIRLGNWNIGAEAESMQYSYRVDTTRSEALLLRYAVVLENPSHIPTHQPRFRFEITDERGNQLNQICYSADFVSNESLGWNSYSYDTNYVLWKDWTPVGVNLQNLHGERININLTTYDCQESGHFGYAYYTLECGTKDILATNCGEVHENTFIAPEGFTYQWYNIDSTDVILGTERTFTSSQNGTYKCRAYFPGAAGNSNCYFEKTVVVGDAYPYANFEYEIVDTNDCLVAIQFYNRSIVTSDSLHTMPTGMECGSRYWNFGDGGTSYDKHPLHYFAPGWYDVSLSAMIGADSSTCTHDTTIRIFVPSPCITYDSIDTAICQGDTLWVRETPLTTTCDTIVRDDYRVDSIMATIVKLVVHPVFDTMIFGAICDEDPYTLFGFNENTPGDYTHHFQSIHGCDSIYRLNLVNSSRYDTTLVVRACDNTGYSYRDTILYETGILVDSLMSVRNCDSIVTISLTIDTSYQLYTVDTICHGDTVLFYGEQFFLITDFNHIDSTVAGCDSNEHLSLWVNPRYASFDTVHMCSYESYTYRGQDYSASYDILDSLMTTRNCDSVIHIALRLHDSTFRADAVISSDSTIWLRGDTILAGCTPMKVWFRDLSVNASNITWYFGDGESSDNRHGFHVYPDSGIYSVTMIAQSNAGCYDTLTMKDAIQVFQRHNADFTWTPLSPSINDATVSFINLTEPPDSLSPYTWYFFPANADTTDSPSDSVSAFEMTWKWMEEDYSTDYRQYVVLASWRNHETLRHDTLVCLDTSRHWVLIANIYLQFPNCVTPNGDGFNDTWSIVNLTELGYYPTNRLRIYDRWGRLVYQRQNMQTGDDAWDPNECDCPDGTYFFRFDAQGEYGFVNHNGAIEVIR